MPWQKGFMPKLAENVHSYPGVNTKVMLKEQQHPQVWGPDHSMGLLNPQQHPELPFPPQNPVQIHPLPLSSEQRHSRASPSTQTVPSSPLSSPGVLPFLQSYFPLLIPC